MNRREFLKTSVCGISAMAAAVHAAAQPVAGRPLNVVLILADDLGWSDLACYGADLHETPNLDRLAQEGMRFTQAYAAAPVCSPTRASIMTGKSPARLHMTIWREAAENPPTNRALLPPVASDNMPQEEKTIAEAFHDAGYLTAHVGKWHLGEAENYPEVHGFDINIGGTLWGAPATFFYPYRGDKAFREYRYIPGVHGGKEGEYLTDRFTDEAIKILEAANGQPIFLNLWYHSVHTPIEGKPELVEHFRKKLKPDFNHQNVAYAAMVHSLDENVGRILAKLDELGMRDNTLVLFTSDNGGFIGQNNGETVTNNAPLRSGKGSLYEGGLRVPLIVRYPGMTQAGSIHDRPVISTDFYPTLLEATGVAGDAEHNAHLEGLSLVPVLKNPDAVLDRDALFFHYPHYYATSDPVSGIRNAEWKLLEFHEASRVELYNIEDDPYETTDLAGTHPEIAAALRDRLHAWQKEVGAQMPTPNPEFKRQR